MTPPLRDFSPDALDLNSLCAFPASDLPLRVARIMDRADQMEWQPTSVTRETYLDLAERLVRTAAPWQDAQGATIDPVAGKETGQTSPRFVASAAVLLGAGRIPDLCEQVFLGMDWCCMRLSSGAAESPDFWLRELMTAWWALEGIASVPDKRREQWRAHLTAIDAERHNWFVEKPDKPIETLHNWVVYASAGEGMREVAGLIPEGRPFLCGNAFWEKYMRAQIHHFTEHGMYRDPGDPMTYDMTTRLQIAVPLAYGLETPLRPVYEELLRRGALAHLLYVTPNGQAPFGGRSSAFHMQECILAALGELEARRYRTADPRLAGAFKRQAHLGVELIRPWMEAEPPRHLKNWFPPNEMHGCEPYAGYAVYSLFAASCLVLAAQFADESIAEAPTPAELGGYVQEFQPAFHKVFASCGGTQVEIDTRADLHNDATGLGRVIHRDLPPDTVLASPIPAHPGYRIPEELQPAKPIAIGPEWQNLDGTWTSLAELGKGLTHTLEVHRETPEEVAFSLQWQHEERGVDVREHYVLHPGKLAYTATVNLNGKPTAQLRLNMPVLHSDGEETSRCTMGAGQLTLNHRKAHLEISFTHASLEGGHVANRNAKYRILQITEPSATASETERCLTLKIG